MLCASESSVPTFAHILGGEEVVKDLLRMLWGISCRYPRFEYSLVRFAQRANGDGLVASRAVSHDVRYCLGRIDHEVQYDLVEVTARQGTAGSSGSKSVTRSATYFHSLRDT